MKIKTVAIRSKRICIYEIEVSTWIYIVSNRIFIGLLPHTYVILLIAMCTCCLKYKVFVFLPVSVY